MPLPSFARRPRLDREGMDPLGQQIAQRGIDGALPGDAGLAREGCRDDLHGEVAFAPLIMTGMAPVLFAVIDDSEIVGRKSSLQPPLNVLPHRA